MVNVQKYQMHKKLPESAAQMWLLINLPIITLQNAGKMPITISHYELEVTMRQPLWL